MRFHILLILILSVGFFSPNASALNIEESKISTDATIKGDDLLSYNITLYSPTADIGVKKDNVLVGDGQISDLWQYIPGSAVSSWGENGEIKSAFDGSHAYFLMTMDISMSWITLQIDGDQTADAENYNDEMEPMQDGDDFWIFGETSEVSAVGDASAAGTSNPYAVPDLQNDLYWERIQNNDTDGTTALSISWEVKRTLDTKDTAGYDAVFSNAANVSMLLASDINHKNLAKVVHVKFALTDLTLGGGDPVPVEEDKDIQETRDVVLYLFTYISLSLFVGSFTYAFTIILSVYLIRKEIE